jgi:predicted 2-oxoglutarate/Fe(II)-dependent dioxygenase YbiX
MGNGEWGGVEFSVGDRAPSLVGADATGRFYSSDAQAGRPALIVTLGGLDPTAAMQTFKAVYDAKAALEALGVDAVPIVPLDTNFAAIFSEDPDASDILIYVNGGEGLEAVTLEGRAMAILVDRGGRVVDLAPVATTSDITDCLRRSAGRIATHPAVQRTTTAPVLMIPNLAPPELCTALIAHFEASPHEVGVMASFADGAAYAKLDESKKRRRDLELTAADALYAPVMNLLAARVAPELKRAFQADIATADRILIARYDDTGGYFKRHRDNSAPHTAFREFAISLNLNTHEYEGGELLFPEYDDDRYNPPAGGAILFSASLLHEAAPVTKGSRYVLLTFLGSAAAQARVTAWQESQG